MCPFNSLHCYQNDQRLLGRKVRKLYEFRKLFSCVISEPVSYCFTGAMTLFGS
jgi:hypothetical protein